MAQNNAYFTFCAQPVMPKNKPLVTEREVSWGGKKNKALSLSFGVKDGNNMVYVDAFDSVKDNILTFNTEREKIEIDWDDRLDPDIIKTVASFRQYSANLDGERHDFITAYDMIEYLRDTLPAYEGDIVVNGQFKMKPSKGRVHTHFEITSVYAAHPDEKRRFALRADIFYNKESLDETDAKKSGKLFLNAYIPMYINSDEKMKYLPLPCVFNTKVYNLADEKHKTLYDHKMEFIKIRERNYRHMLWELRVVSGTEEVPFDESMLSKLQKRQIQLGQRTLEDFRPRRPINGEKITEYRLFEPVLTGEFAEGMVDTGLPPREFEELVYRSVPAVEPNPETAPAVPAASGIDEESLF